MPLNRYLAVKKEASYGEGLGGGSYSNFYKIASESLEPVIDFEYDDDSVHSYWLEAAYAKGKRVEGSIDFYLNPHMIGHLLLGLLGGHAVVQPDPANAPNTYRHTFTPANTIPSLVMRVGRDIDAEEIVGVAVDSLSIEIEAGAGRISTSADLIGQSAQSTSHVTPTFPTTRDFTPADVSITLGGVTKKPRSISLEITNNLSTDHYVLDGSLLLPDIKFSDKREISGTMEIDFDSVTEYNNFLNQTKQGLIIDIVGDTIEATYKYQLKIEIPQIMYESVSVEESGVEPIVASFDFVALKPSTGDIITITLTNREANYT